MVKKQEMLSPDDFEDYIDDMQKIVPRIIDLFAKSDLDGARSLSALRETEHFLFRKCRMTPEEYETYLKQCIDLYKIRWGRLDKNPAPD